MNESNTIRFNSGRILGFSQFGDPKGKPLFFFHGWPSSRLQAKVFDTVARKLKIRIISPDRPGFGISDFQENRMLLDWPDDISQLADFLKIKKFSVLGQSGGGPYSVVCAYKIAERLIKAGISVGLAPTNIDGVLEGMEWSNKLAWKLYNRFPFVMNLSSSLFLLQSKNLIPLPYKFQFKSKADKKILSDPKLSDSVKRVRYEAFRQGKDGALQDLKIYIGNWGFNLKDIKAKVFLWYGDDDKNVSVNMGKYYQSQIPGSVLKIYPGEGHLILNTHTEEILSMLVS